MKICFSGFLILILLANFSFQTVKSLPSEELSSETLTWNISGKLQVNVKNYINTTEISNNENSFMFNQMTMTFQIKNNVFAIQLDSNSSDKILKNESINGGFVVIIIKHLNSHGDSTKEEISNQTLQSKSYEYKTLAKKQAPNYVYKNVGFSFIEKDFWLTSFKIHLILKLNDQIYHLTIIILIQTGRLSETVVLSNEKRRKIYEYLKKHPGAYLREIMKNFNLGVHAVKWHLEVLERFRFISHFRCGRYLIFYPTERKPSKLQVQIRITLLNKNTVRILDLISSNPGITQITISRQIGLHKNTVSYHVRKLTDLGMIDKIRHKRSVQLYMIQHLHECQIHADA